MAQPALARARELVARTRNIARARGFARTVTPRADLPSGGVALFFATEPDEPLPVRAVASSAGGAGGSDRRLRRRRPARHRARGAGPDRPAGGLRPQLRGAGAAGRGPRRPGGALRQPGRAELPDAAVRDGGARPARDTARATRTRASPTSTRPTTSPSSAARPVGTGCGRCASSTPTPGPDSSAGRSSTTTTPGPRPGPAATRPGCSTPRPGRGTGPRSRTGRWPATGWRWWRACSPIRRSGSSTARIPGPAPGRRRTRRLTPRSGGGYEPTGTGTGRRRRVRLAVGLRRRLHHRHLGRRLRLAGDGQAAGDHRAGRSGRPPTGCAAAADRAATGRRGCRSDRRGVAQSRPRGERGGARRAATALLR